MLAALDLPQGSTSELPSDLQLVFWHAQGHTFGWPLRHALPWAVGLTAVAHDLVNHDGVCLLGHVLDGTWPVVGCAFLLEAPRMVRQRRCNAADCERHSERDCESSKLGQHSPGSVEKYTRAARLRDRTDAVDRSNHFPMANGEVRLPPLKQWTCHRRRAGLPYQEEGWSSVPGH